MKLEDMSAEVFRKTSDDELLIAHLRLHQWFRDAQRERRKRIIKLHRAIVEEFASRGFHHHVHDALDRTLPEELQKSSAISHLPTFTFIPEFVSITGSAIYAKDRYPNDVDVVFACDEDFTIRPDASLRLKVDRILQEFYNGKETSWSRKNVSTIGES